MSSRYRKVAHGSNVDESLFASSRARSAGSARKAVDASKILSSTGRHVTTPPANSVFVSTADIMRIKAETVIKTTQDLQRDREEAQRAAEERQAAAKARKARMLELEAERKRNAPLSILEQEKKDEDAAILARAAVARNEVMDDVKTMNAYGKYAKTVMVRDEQRQERKEREAREREEERLRDIQMEIDRLRTVKAYQDREAMRKSKMVEDRKIIEVQIRQRKAARVAEREAVRKEQEEALARAVAEAEAERLKLVHEQEEAKVHLEQILVANAAAIQAKAKIKQDEVEEDRRIMEYLKQEDEKKRRREEEEEERKQQRELEIARLRAQQEKHADKQAELDALRARRAFEAAERDFRRRELEEARRRAAAAEEMRAARDKQQHDKEVLLAEEAARQREEYTRNLAVQQEWMSRENQAEVTYRQAAHHHKDELNRMIAEREEARRRERQAFLHRGVEEEEARQAELAKLRAIRDRKVADLQDVGVDTRYLVQLQRYKPEDILSKDYRLGGKVPSLH